MRSVLTEDFIVEYQKLPERIRQQARKNYQLWKVNPQHPSLQYKKVHSKLPIYSVRIGIGWRALGLVEGDCIGWFWVGSHARYDQLLKQR